MTVKGAEEGVRKGPWKVEEDEVLLNHVNKYGPRDWSSIRSKGLLHRTGKSCRLRWVNKLRPNLKMCKFSVEEERVVLELQAEFGNKWAKIATYLPGRTDNDVKNFWSSRQKKLARILHTSATPPNKFTHKNKDDVPDLFHVTPTNFEDPNLSFSSSNGESSSKPPSSISCNCIDNNYETIKMVPLSDLIGPKLLANETYFVEPEVNPIDQKHSCLESHLQISDFTFSSESQELVARLDHEPYFLDVLGLGDASGLESETQLSIGPPIFDNVGSCQSVAREKIDNSVAPDGFFDDFPEDMFDRMERLPSPPQP